MNLRTRLADWWQSVTEFVVTLRLIVVMIAVQIWRSITGNNEPEL